MHSARVQVKKWPNSPELNIELAMSALGHKRTSEEVRPMSALPPKADIVERDPDVRFVPKADIEQRGPNVAIRSTCRLWRAANPELLHLMLSQY
jgi:hypothetical protein